MKRSEPNDYAIRQLELGVWRLEKLLELAGEKSSTKNIDGDIICLKHAIAILKGEVSDEFLEKWRSILASSRYEYKQKFDALEAIRQLIQDYVKGGGE